jgi:hypothetical protein
MEILWLPSIIMPSPSDTTVMDAGPDGATSAHVNLSKIVRNLETEAANPQLVAKAFLNAV